MTDVSWWLFLVSSVVIIVAPGQDMILVMSRALALGASAGVVTAAGVASGLMVHTVLATLGVGVIIQASAGLFLTMKLVGACYLVYLGILMFRAGGLSMDPEPTGSRSHWRLYMDGAVSNIANPKIAVFYFAFLPQFVPTGVDRAGPVIFVLGTTFALLTLIIKAPVGWFSSMVSGWLRAKPVRLQWLYRFSGMTLIALAVHLTLQARPSP